MERADLSTPDSALWRWATNGCHDGIVGAAREIIFAANGRSTHITVETVFTSGGGPLSHIRDSGTEFSESIHNEGVVVGRYVDTDGSWIVAEFSTRYENVYHVVTNQATTQKRWRRFERWIGTSRGISRCFLDHSDFSSIGDRISEFGDVEVIRMSGRVVSDHSSITRGFPTHGTDLRPNHLDVIEETESRNATVRTIVLRVRGVLHLHLRRVAGATFYGGGFELFKELVLSRLEDSANSRRSLLSNRHRRRSEPVRPITVRLTQAALYESEDTADVLSSVHDLTDVTVAVFHRNPYLHFTVTDEYDGSNFDVMVTQPNEIDIYPGYRASMDSLARVTNKLSDRFGASEISEAPEPELVRFADLAEVDFH